MSEQEYTTAPLEERCRTILERLEALEAEVRELMRQAQSLPPADPPAGKADPTDALLAALAAEKRAAGGPLDTKKTKKSASSDVDGLVASVLAAGKTDERSDEPKEERLAAEQSAERAASADETAAALARALDARKEDPEERPKDEADVGVETLLASVLAASEREPEPEPEPSAFLLRLPEEDGAETAADAPAPAEAEPDDRPLRELLGDLMQIDFDNYTPPAENPPADENGGPAPAVGALPEEFSDGEENPGDAEADAADLLASLQGLRLDLSEASGETERADDEIGADVPLMLFDLPEPDGGNASPDPAPDTPEPSDAPSAADILGGFDLDSLFEEPAEKAPPAQEEPARREVSAELVEEMKASLEAIRRKNKNANK